MGKARSSKKGRPATSNQVTPKAGSTSISALEADLASLEEGKRQKACMLLADLYRFNVSNKFSLDTLTSSNILSKLSMRLVDTSDKVRVQASSALKNLSESKDAAIIHRLISMGIIRSSVTLFIESVTNANWSSADGVEYAENLLHTLANAVSCNENAIGDIVSTNAAFLSNIITLINVTVPASIISAVANLLIIIASHSTTVQILDGNPSSAAYQSRLDSIWSFIELLASYKSSGAHDMSTLGIFAGSSAAKNKNSALIDADTREQQLFQLKVLMIECLEVVIGVYTSAANSSSLASVCRIGRALQLLNEELHVSLNGIQVTAATISSTGTGSTGEAGKVADEGEMDADEADMTEASEVAPEEGTNSQVDPEVAANIRRLGLCKVSASSEISS